MCVKLATLALLLPLVAACGDRAEVRGYARDMGQWYDQATASNGLFLEYDYFVDRYSIELGVQTEWQGYMGAWPAVSPPQALEASRRQVG